MGIKIQGTVILVCDDCGAGQTVDITIPVHGKHVFLWWLIDAKERCKICRPLSNPAAPSTVTGTRPTSKLAAYQALPRSGTQRRRVLDWIAQTDRTDEEIRDLEIGHQGGMNGRIATDTRRSELEQGGWVTDSGRTRKTRADKDAIVWILTGPGRTGLDSLPS